MSSWLESQIEARAKQNDAMEDRAYMQLARSVSGSQRRASFADGEPQTDKAAKTCLEYLKAEPGVIPDGVKDLDERLD